MQRTQGPPRRVVSLVPSTTGSLFDLGLGNSLIAVTDYCIHPEAQLAHLPRIGGTKNPDIEAIVNLAPDLVFANQEENTPAVVRALEAAGIAVHLSFPKTVADALSMLNEIVEVYESRLASQRVAQLTAEIEQGQQRLPAQPLTVFVPIWEDRSGGTPWWMTFNRGTFTHDLLGQAGFANVFAQRERRYPLASDLGAAKAHDAAGGDTRYPRVTRDEILAAAPDLILLPSEPYAYSHADVERIAAALAGAPAADNGRILSVDGSLLTWPGTRIGRALPALLDLHAEVWAVAA